MLMNIIYRAVNQEKEIWKSMASVVFTLQRNVFCQNHFSSSLFLTRFYYCIIIKFVKIGVTVVCCNTGGENPNEVQLSVSGGP